MVQLIPKPDPQALLPSLLACLPIAIASPKPPPALLPLLTPILRQRVQLLSSNSSNNSWLRLLSWNQEAASKLPFLVGKMKIEPHPVSGEVEFDEIQEIRFRRLDPETLHSRMKVQEFGLSPTYLWCMGGEEDGANGWRLSELRALEDAEDGTEWLQSIDEAEEAFKSGVMAPSEAAKPGNHIVLTNLALPSAKDYDDDDDSAYWAAYDQTPGRTPAKRSPAPIGRPNVRSIQSPSAPDAEYFARYMNQVQPVMDPYDPDEDVEMSGDPSLSRGGVDHSKSDIANGGVESLGNGIGTAAQDSVELVVSAPDEPVHPRPLSSASSEKSIERLERRAETQTQAEIGVKQHISTDIKSLYRLARSAGIDRSEFQRIVSTELEMLGMMDLE